MSKDKTSKDKMKKDKVVKDKMKVKIYLSFPNNVYYEMMIEARDVIGNLFKYLQRFFPKTKYEYNTDNPIFIHMEIDDETGIEKDTILDISKTYIEHNLYNGYSTCSTSSSSSVCNVECECSIKIKLKITPLKETVK